MTTIRQELVTCAVCGELTQIMVMDSTSTFGPPISTYRPAEMARSSIFAWIQRCSFCGYCAPTVDEATPTTREVVTSDAYRAQLADEDFPALARSFLCSSMIFEEHGDQAAAARNAIEAAWVCDDEDIPGAATQCRLRADPVAPWTRGEGRFFVFRSVHRVRGDRRSPASCGPLRGCRCPGRRRSRRRRG